MTRLNPLFLIQLLQLSLCAIFVNSGNNKEIYSIFYCTLTNHLTDFWATMLLEKLKVKSREHMREPVLLINIWLS
jgi:hypothetical protein